METRQRHVMQLQAKGLQGWRATQELEEAGAFLRGVQSILVLQEEA